MRDQTQNHPADHSGSTDPWWDDRREAADRGRSGLRIALFAVSAALLLILVAIGAVLAILLSGATEVGFVRERIEATLKESLGPGYRVTVAKAVVKVDPVLGLVVEADDTTIADDAGNEVAAVPSTRLAVDPLSLIRLAPQVSAVELASARFSFVRSADGRLHLGDRDTALPPAADAPDNAPATTGDGGFPDLANAIRDLDRGLEVPLAAASDAGLLRFTIRDATVTLSDGAETRSLTGAELAASIDPASGDLTATVAITGLAGRWSATIGRKVDAATGDRLLSASFSELTLADILPEFAGADSPFGDEIPLFGRASAHLGADGTVQDAALRLDVGAGVFRIGDDQAFLLDEASVKLRWDTADGAIVIDPSPIFFGETRGIVTGIVRAEGDRRYDFALESRGAILAPRDSGEEPLVADRIEVAGGADLAAGSVVIDNLIIETARGSFAATGSLGFEGETPSLSMTASLTPMAIATWKQMWPSFLAPGARRWALENIVDGRIASARFAAEVPPGVLFKESTPALSAEAMRLDLRLEDVTFRTFGEAPPIADATGNVVLAGSTFGVDLVGGEVHVPSGATVAVNAGAFGIDNVFDPSGEGIVELQLSGAASALGEIANARPFSALDRRKIAPADLSGNADAAVSVRVPLELRPGEEGARQVDWKVVVTGTGLASSAPIEGRMFSDAAVTISVTPDAVAIDGTASIDGVPAGVRIAQPLSVDGRDAAGGEQVARLALDRDARLKLGLDVEDFVSGTIDAEVNSLADGASHYDLDLARARLVMPGLGWSKGIGVAATLSFDLIRRDGGYEAEKIVLAGDGFGLAGRARLEDDAGLVSAAIDRFALREGDSIAFTMTRKGSGYAISAEGAAFDVRGVIAEIKGEGESDSGDAADVSVDAAIGRVTGFNGEAIEAARLSFVAAGGITRKLTLTGRLAGKVVSLAYADSLDRASIQAGAGDAGATLRFLDLYTRAAGGGLSLAGVRPGPAGPIAGTLSVTEFAVLDEPAVAQMVSTATPASAAQIDTARLHVERMVAQIRYTGDQLLIDDAFIRGNAIGASFSGGFDLVRSLVSISGTYIPAYGLNNVFSRVPVVGRILGGGTTEGLIGVTFKIEGAIDDPRILVNPLSAVAPGIFRRIFEFR